MTPNETANVTPNETANVMHMNSSLVDKFGNRPARSHRNPKLWILTKLDLSECIKTPRASMTPLGPTVPWLKWGVVRLPQNPFQASLWIGSGLGDPKAGQKEILG